MTPAELRDLRTGLNLSQSGLARLLGVNAMTISRWERGERGIPPYLRLALDHLSVPPGHPAPHSTCSTLTSTPGHSPGGA